MKLFASVLLLVGAATASPFLYDTTLMTTTTSYTSTTTSVSVIYPSCYSSAAGIPNCARKKRSLEPLVTINGKAASMDEIAPSRVRRDTYTPEEIAKLDEHQVRAAVDAGLISPEDAAEARLLGSFTYVSTVTEMGVSTATSSSTNIFSVQTLAFDVCFPTEVTASVSIACA